MKNIETPNSHLLSGILLGFGTHILEKINVLTSLEVLTIEPLEEI